MPTGRISRRRQRRGRRPTSSEEPSPPFPKILGNGTPETTATPRAKKHAAETHALIAKAAGVSREQVRKYKVVEAKAPETVAKIDAGETTIHKIEVIKTKAPEAVRQKLRAGEATIHAEYKAIKKAERRRYSPCLNSRT
jgi:hypothetical protein